jgi:hypothetical protein
MFTRFVAYAFPAAWEAGYQDWEEHERAIGAAG